MTAEAATAAIPVHVKLGRLLLRAASFAMSIWALIVYLGAYHGELGFWAGYFGWIFGAWIATLVHEIGHALAAVACNWRVLLLVARPFGLKLSGPEFVLVPRSLWRGLGGFMAAVPRRPADASKGRYAYIVAAGPAAIAFIGAVIFIAVAIWSPAVGRSGFDLRLMSFAFALQALHSVLFSLLPARSPVISSDGDKLRDLGRSDSNWSRNRVLIWLRVLDLSNESLRDVPQWMLDEARRHESPDTALHLAVNKIAIALDSASVDVPRTRTLIDEFRAAHGSSAWLDSCDAYLAAIWEADACKASAILWTGGVKAEERAIVMAAEAAVAAREGQQAIAQTRLADMRIAEKTQSPFRDTSLDEWDRQIEAVIKSGSGVTDAGQR